MWHRADPLLPPRGSHTSPEGSALRVPGQHCTGGTAPIVPRLKKKKRSLWDKSVVSPPALSPPGRGTPADALLAPPESSHISELAITGFLHQCVPPKMGFIIRLNLRGVLGASRMKAASGGGKKVKAAPRGAHLPPASGSPPRHLQFPRAGRMRGGIPSPAVLPVRSRNHEGKTTLTRGKRRADTG